MFHAHMIKTIFDKDVSIANALVTMYTKCGSIEDGAGKALLGGHFLANIAWQKALLGGNCLVPAESMGTWS